MFNPEKTIGMDMAGCVTIKLAQPFDMELETYPKLYGILSFYAEKNGMDIVDFASDILRKHLGGGSSEAAMLRLGMLTQEHRISREKEILNQLANALTILSLREYLRMKRGS